MGLIETEHYHAHVYFDVGIPDQQFLAQTLREKIGQIFPVVLGQVFDRPIGPHPLPMFQVLIGKAQLCEVTSWLQSNRQGLTILIHAVSGDDLEDHTMHCIWLGSPYPLKLDALR